MSGKLNGTRTDDASVIHKVRSVFQPMSLVNEMAAIPAGAAQRRNNPCATSCENPLVKRYNAIGNNTICTTKNSNTSFQ